MISTFSITRRGFVLGTIGISTAAILSGCATKGSGETGGGSPGSTALTLQSSLSDPQPKKALEALVKAYKGDVTLNTVAIEQFRAQLSTYLTSENPPDVLTWYAGSVARDYASKGYLLDISDLWDKGGPAASYSTALKELSTSDAGKQIFMPTNYYWWGVFFLRSRFKEWGVTAPKTWDEFLALCGTLKSKGINPLSNGIGTTPWMASGWFDILNLRINGADFHRELLAGKHSFDSAEVRKVMAHYAMLVPYFDPNMTAYAWQDAITPLVQGKNAMYLVGAFISQSIPQGGDPDDLDFFSVPVIDPAIPVAEEAPTDGYFASAKTRNVDATKAFLTYLAEPESQQKFIEAAGSSNLPTSPDVDVSKFSPLVQKGLKTLQAAAQITQYFNRDSSDALQTTADAALTKFLANPADVDSILKEWQAAAERVWSS